MITRSLSHRRPRGCFLPSGERGGSVAEPSHKGIFPRRGGARCPGPGRQGHTLPNREQAERATVANNYWSSATNASNPTNAWNVNFNNGNSNTNNKTNNNYVRAVRGGW